LGSRAVRSHSLKDFGWNELMTLWSPKFASQPAVFIPDGPEATYEQLQDQVEAVRAALREGGVQARGGDRQTADVSVIVGLMGKN
jgi:hypothetical protein